MKNILVPTDFSENAENAIVYAIELAKASRARVILFHAYHVVEVPAVILTNEEMEEVNIDRLKKIIEKRYSSTFNEVEIEYLSRIGFLMDGIHNLIEERNVDLLVMGRTGASQAQGSSAGKNTIKVINHTEIPTLVIPEKARFKRPEQIAYASDFSNMIELVIPPVLEDFTRIFNSRLALVHVVSEEELVLAESSRTSDKLKLFLQDTQHTLHFPVNEDVVEGIHDFARNISADMIVMMPRKHNFLERIFLESNTEKLAYESSVPILAVHESEQ
jgi:nucleotide-binding universal stress UspA family protein